MTVETETVQLETRAFREAKQGQTKLAAKLAEKAWWNNRKHSALVHRAVQWHVESNDAPSASRWMREVLSYEPSNVEYILLAVHLELAQSNFQQAQKYIHTLLKVDPNHTEAHDLAAEIHRQHGSLLQSIQHWATAEVTPSNIRKEPQTTPENLYVAQPERSKRLVDTLGTSRSGILNYIPLSIYQSNYLNYLHHFLSEDSHVLCLNCGPGVLALYVAHAGAKKVIGCNHNPELVHLASKLAKGNHLEDTVSFCSYHQYEQTMHLPNQEPPNLVIVEFPYDTLESIQVLADHHNIAQYLPQQNTKLFPDFITLIVAPVGSTELHQYATDSAIKGLDLRQISDISYQIPTSIDAFRFVPQLLSHPYTVLELPMYQTHSPSLEQDIVIQMSTSGELSGFLMWSDLWAGGQQVASTKASRHNPHARQAFLPIAKPRSVSAGDFISLRAILKDRVLWFEVQ